MHPHGADLDTSALPWVAVAPLALAAIAYLAAAASERLPGRRGWPARRTWFWMLGLATAASTLLGPLADAAHHNQVAHMAAHLLIGMVAPVLLVLAAPVTLALRTLDVVPARRLTRLLRSAPARHISHPITAGLLNIGSLWVLYRSPLHEAMRDNPLLNYAVLAHYLLVGCLFTAAIIGIDPNPHRASHRLRACVLLLAIAGHATLAKVLYAHTPTGVPVDEARAAAQLMYYGGDAIELVLIAVFCASWYRHTAPHTAQRRRRSAAVVTRPPT